MFVACCLWWLSRPFQASKKVTVRRRVRYGGEEKSHPLLDTVVYVARSVRRLSIVISISLLGVQKGYNENGGKQNAGRPRIEVDEFVMVQLLR